MKIKELSHFILQDIVGDNSAPVVIKAAIDLGDKLICNICQTNTGRLVRDHNHRTGMVRGILCELCNSWLGVYEKSPTKRKTTNKKYKEWRYKYQSEIFYHLARTTNLKYNKYN